MEAPEPWESPDECRWHGRRYSKRCGLCDEIKTAREIASEMPALAQDEHALQVIEQEKGQVPYPLLNEDRRSAGALKLLVYLFRLLRWRWQTRTWRRK